MRDRTGLEAAQPPGVVAGLLLLRLRGRGGQAAAAAAAGAERGGPAKIEAKSGIPREKRR